MKEFAKVLKQLRKKNKLTQMELAQHLNISKSAVSMYENGNREPDFETLEAIADFFNVNMDFLLGKSTDEVQTIAAHHDDDEWTEEELAEIEAFKQFVKSKRKK